MNPSHRSPLPSHLWIAAGLAPTDDTPLTEPEKEALLTYYLQNEEAIDERRRQAIQEIKSSHNLNRPVSYHSQRASTQNPQSHQSGNPSRLSHGQNSHTSRQPQRVLGSRYIQPTMYPTLSQAQQPMKITPHDHRQNVQPAAVPQPKLRIPAVDPPLGPLPFTPVSPAGAAPPRQGVMFSDLHHPGGQLRQFVDARQLPPLNQLGSSSSQHRMHLMPMTPPEPPNAVQHQQSQQRMRPIGEQRLTPANQPQQVVAAIHVPAVQNQQSRKRTRPNGEQSSTGNESQHFVEARHPVPALQNQQSRKRMRLNVATGNQPQQLLEARQHMPAVRNVQSRQRMRPNGNQHLATGNRPQQFILEADTSSLWKQGIMCLLFRICKRGRVCAQTASNTIVAAYLSSLWRLGIMCLLFRVSERGRGCAQTASNTQILVADPQQFAEARHHVPAVQNQQTRQSMRSNSEQHYPGNQFQQFKEARHHVPSRQTGSSGPQIEATPAEDPRTSSRRRGIATNAVHQFTRMM
ncbi:hypothetical protein PtB15_14B117 [Puccinia triticina]|nr:hypothetical protein PtB15_14B117 [Puccinia triticina]